MALGDRAKPLDAAKLSLAVSLPDQVVQEDPHRVVSDLRRPAGPPTSTEISVAVTSLKGAKNVLSGILERLAMFKALDKVLDPYH